MYDAEVSTGWQEFLWETHMLYTRMNLKGRHKKDSYECPHRYEGSQPVDIRSPGGLQHLPWPEGEDQPGADPGGEGLLIMEIGHEEDTFGAAAQTETECDRKGDIKAITLHCIVIIPYTKFQFQNNATKDNLYVKISDSYLNCLVVGASEMGTV